jgi:hypothetical protein
LAIACRVRGILPPAAMTALISGSGAVVVVLLVHQCRRHLEPRLNFAREFVQRIWRKKVVTLPAVARQTSGQQSKTTATLPRTTP